jgi:NAD(P)-dependent dehydrogenase (short-subunit alcohol dehydrogenase family)
MSELFNLSGQVAVVTGSTKGIGLGIASRLAEHGAHVVISSRRQAECDAVAAEINGRHGEGRALAQAADLADPESLDRLIATAVAWRGRLDVLVLNAAKADVLGSAAVTSADDFSAMLTVNVVNNAHLAQAALPHLRARGGSAIFISSVSGTGSSASVAAYGVCKRALLQMVDNLALEWAPHGIRVNAIAPGYTVSEATRPLWSNPRAREDLDASIPLGRLGEPDEVAGCAVFLAGPGGAYVTGQTNVVDGGLTLRGAGQRQAKRPDFKAILTPGQAAPSG